LVDPFGQERNKGNKGNKEIREGEERRTFLRQAQDKLTSNVVWLRHGELHYVGNWLMVNGY
jgi:hypothetical protein